MIRKRASKLRQRCTFQNNVRLAGHDRRVVHTQTPPHSTDTHAIQNMEHDDGRI